MGQPEPRLRAITRLVPEKLVSFDCCVCGKHVEEMRLPGPKPKYCSDPCRKHAEALRKRTQRAMTGKNHGKRGRPKKSAAEFHRVGARPRVRGHTCGNRNAGTTEGCPNDKSTNVNT